MKTTIELFLNHRGQQSEIHVTEISDDYEKFYQLSFREQYNDEVKVYMSRKQAEKLHKTLERLLYDETYEELEDKYYRVIHQLEKAQEEIAYARRF